MYKKIIASMLALLMIASVCVLPVSAANVVFDASNIKVTNAAQGIIAVSGKLEAAPSENEYVTIIVLPNSTPYAEYAANTLALGTDVVDLNGDFFTSFRFNQPTGIYDFYVLYDGQAFGPVMFNFISLADTANLIRNIANGTIPKDSLVPQIQAANNGIGLDFDRFPVGFDRNLFIYRLDKARAELTGADDAALLTSFYNLVDKIEAEVDFVQAVNAVTYSGDYLALLQANVKHTGIDFAKYNALDNSLKVKVTDEFLGKFFANGDEIKAAFDVAVAKAFENAGNQGGAAGGSGGSGEGASDGPVIKVSEAKCRVGNTVDVVVSISDNVGFANLGLEIDYDRALNLVDVKAADGIGATFTSAQNYDVYPYNFSFDATSDVTYNGELVTLTFEVPEDAQARDYYVNVDFYKGRNGDYIDGISVNYNEAEKALGLCYENGFINVYDYIPGDINGDGTVTNKDGTALLRHLAGWENINIDENALDADGDGAVTNKDGTVLLRYLAGWSVEVH